MENVNKELSEYFQRLKRLLDCPKPLRNSFLAQTRRMAEDFSVDRPDITQEDLISYLGEPEELAQGFLETLDSEVIKCYKKRKKFLLYGCIAVLVATLICVSVWCVRLLNEPNMVRVTETLIIHSDNMGETK